MKRHLCVTTGTILVLMLAAFAVFPSPASARSFPSIELSSGGHWISGTSHTVSLPSGSGGIVTGDLLIAAFCDYSGSATLPVPWSEFDSDGSYPSQKATMRLWYRIGQTGMPTTVSVTTTGTVGMYQVYRIVGHNQGYPAPEPEDSMDHTISGLNAAPNPPNLTPSYGSKETLWLAVACAESDSGTNLTTTGIPTSYTSNRVDWADAGGPTMILHSTYRATHTSSQNPSNFTTNKAVDWVTATISIEPTDSLPLVTLPATKVRESIAQMNGRLDALYSSTVLLGFEYGTTLSLGNWTSNLTKSSTGTFQIVVSGLSANTKYYFRAISLEIPSGYAGQGEILNFTTAEPTLPFDMIGLFAFAVFLAFTVGGSAAISMWVLGRKRKGGGI